MSYSGEPLTRSLLGNESTHDGTFHVRCLASLFLATKSPHHEIFMSVALLPPFGQRKSSSWNSHVSCSAFLWHLMLCLNLPSQPLARSRPLDNDNTLHGTFHARCLASSGTLLLRLNLPWPTSDSFTSFWTMKILFMGLFMLGISLPSGILLLCLNLRPTTPLKLVRPPKSSTKTFRCRPRPLLPGP